MMVVTIKKLKEKMCVIKRKKMLIKQQNHIKITTKI